MSKPQRLQISVVLVNGKRELVGWREVTVPPKFIKILEKLGQLETQRFAEHLTALCDNELTGTPLHRD